MDFVYKLGTIGFMKLSDYLQKHHITPAEFTRKIGAKGSATISRYLSGERTPNAKIMERIEQATSGLVSKRDFGDQAKIERRVKYEKLMLHCDFSPDFVQNANLQDLPDFWQDLGLKEWRAANDNLSFPIWQAKQVLQARLEIAPNQDLILDNCRRDIKSVIGAANQILAMLGKNLIYYPGINPLYRRFKKGIR